MAGERFFTRIPPSSTGNRISLRHSAIVPYTNKTGTFSKDMMIVFATSGFMAHIDHIEVSSPTSGTLYVHYDDQAVYDNLNPQVGENINDEDGNTIGQVAVGVADLYHNTTHITSYDNPSHGLRIDDAGSANIRFEEGVPLLDSFGKLRVSGATILGEYVFANSNLTGLFSTKIQGNASIGWDPDKRAALLTNSTTSGDYVSHRTNTYHHYIPGSSQLWIATLALSDNNKPGVGRSWGMFDDRNGFFFSHVNGELRCTIRSDVTGSVVDNYITQADWNRDRLDGTGRSGMNIDVSLDNLYWADVQWLGAGRVRFGVYYNGQRVVCHEYYHANTQPYPFSATASLPLSFGQRNVAATGSSSEMRVFCAAVWTETDVDLKTLGNPGLRTVGTIVSTNDQYQYMATFTPKKLNNNSRDNRSIYFPTELEVVAYDTVTRQPVIVELEVIAEPVLSGLQFQSDPGSSVEVDTSGTLHGGGQAIYKMFASGHEHADLTPIYNNLYSGAVKNYAENGGYREIQITSISNAATPTIIAAQPWNVREGFPLTMKDALGMTEINGVMVYLKITGLTTGQLYTDAALTTPLDTSTFGDYTASSGKLTGDFGQQFYWMLKCKTLTGNGNPVRVIGKVSWKEIVQ